MAARRHRAFFDTKDQQIKGIKIMNYLNKGAQITGGFRKSFRSTVCKLANRICYGYTTAADGRTNRKSDASIVTDIRITTVFVIGSIDDSCADAGCHRVAV